MNSLSRILTVTTDEVEKVMQQLDRLDKPVGGAPESEWEEFGREILSLATQLEQSLRGRSTPPEAVDLFKVMFAHLERNASSQWGPWLDEFSPDLRSTLPTRLDVGYGGQPKQIPSPNPPPADPHSKRLRTPLTKIGPPRRKVKSGDDDVPYSITSKDWSDLLANKSKMKAWVAKQKEQRIDRCERCEKRGIYCGFETGKKRNRCFFCVISKKVCSLNPYSKAEKDAKPPAPAKSIACPSSEVLACKRNLEHFKTMERYLDNMIEMVIRAEEGPMTRAKAKGRQHPPPKKKTRQVFPAMNRFTPTTPTTPAAASELAEIKRALLQLTPPGSGAAESEWENWGRKSAVLIGSPPPQEIGVIMENMVKTLETNARRNWGAWLDEVCPGTRERLPAGVEQRPAPVVRRPARRSLTRRSPVPPRKPSPRRISVLQPSPVPDEDENSGEESESGDDVVAHASPLVPAILPTHLKRTNWLSLANDQVRMPVWVAAQKEQRKPTCELCEVSNLYCAFELDKDKNQSGCFACTESKKPCSLDLKEAGAEPAKRIDLKEVGAEPAKRKRDKSNVLGTIPSKRVRVDEPTTTPSPSPVPKPRRVGPVAAPSTPTSGPSTRRTELNHRAEVLGRKMSLELLKMMKGYMHTMIEMAEKDLAELGESVEKDDDDDANGIELS
ncbi:hypothetical protein F5887DRAFT_931266 [Amanita rubescens]|nr:hypothetical protein F5887DRAFT_931266 [Amanita rubescens]